MTDPTPRTAREVQAALEAEREGHPFLLLRREDDTLRVVALDQARSVARIGRSPGLEVTIGWDPEVSRLHAELQAAGGDWSVYDDGLSRNGTFVNGERVRNRRRLCDGDLVRCGSTSMVYRLPTRATARTTRLSNRPHDLERITPAQHRVLVALCRPFADADSYATPATNQQIADELFISPESVKTHLRALFEKLGADELPQNQKRAKVAKTALELGLVTRAELAARP